MRTLVKKNTTLLLLLYILIQLAYLLYTHILPNTRFEKWYFLFLISGIPLLLYAFIYAINSEDAFQRNYHRFPRMISKKAKINRVQFVKYLEQNYRDPHISIKRVSDNFGISQGSVAKLLEDEFDMDFSEYIDHLRMLEAIKLLTGTDKSIYQISMDIGYNYQASFDNRFEESTGVSPSEFRNKKMNN